MEDNALYPLNEIEHIQAKAVRHLRSANTSLVDKPVVFESHEHHIIYMNKLYLSGLLN